MTSQSTVTGLARATAERVRQYVEWLYAHRVWLYLIVALTIVGGVIALLFADTVAAFYQGLGFHTMYPRRRAAEDVTVAVWIVIGCAIAVGVSIPLGAALFRVGAPITRRLWRSAGERRAERATAPTAPIGHTTDGQPIYPVVGYTSDGTPVTADRAVGVRPQSPGTNGLAVAALILAFVFAPVGAILGFVAKAQINKTGQQGNGLALAGIIIGTVITVVNVVAIMVVLGSM